MEIHRSDAAQLLRRIRERAGLTLKEAATHFDMSPSLLGQKERGEKSIERVDIRNAIEIYALSPWDGYELWFSAGFIPERTVAPISTQGLFSLTVNLLQRIPYPAYLIDSFGFIRAWNVSYDDIWNIDGEMGQIPGMTIGHLQNVHIIDHVVSPPVRSLLQEQWTPFAVQMIHSFYRQSLPVANDSFFQRLIHTMKETHGQSVVDIWNKAHTYQPPQEANELYQPYTFTLEHPEIGIGAVEFLAMSTIFQFDPSFEVRMHLPIGDGSRKRFAELQRNLGDISVSIL